MCIHITQRINGKQFDSWTVCYAYRVNVFVCQNDVVGCFVVWIQDANQLFRFIVSWNHVKIELKYDANAILSY